MQLAYYRKKLKEDFSRRNRINKSYSLRAYARDLGIHPATLSQVLLGKRALPPKNADQIIDRLKLGAKERTLFKESIRQKRDLLDTIKIPDSENQFILDESYYQIIAEWEHYAVLSLFDCMDFRPTLMEISERLDIPKTRAEVVVDNLLACGLLERAKNKTLIKTQPQVRTTEDVISPALRASHRENLEIAGHKLDTVPTELRDFSSIMVAMSDDKIPEVKIIIREFRNKLAQLLKNGRKDKVYQLAIQFYPLTKTKSKTGGQK